MRIVASTGRSAEVLPDCRRQPGRSRAKARGARPRCRHARQAQAGTCVIRRPRERALAAPRHGEGALVAPYQ
eukprot:11158737-Lingulodinium_polyedra.AAC.1